MRTFITHTCRPRTKHHRALNYTRAVTHLRTCALYSIEEVERLYGVDRAVLPYDQIVGPMLSERLYGGIGEKSIGYPRKVYRVFRKSL